MIADAAGTVVLSSMGWVDGDALWQFDPRSGSTRSLRVGSGARHLALHAGDGGRFALAHHFDGARFEVTVRDLASPLAVLARAGVSAEGAALGGDRSAWRDVPRLYVAFLGFQPWADHVLIRVSPESDRVEVQRFAWYDQSYDKMYQGVIGAIEMPGEPCALVAVQRSSRLIVHDLATGACAGHIDLAGRAGNPRPVRHGDEIWASDFDTLAVIRAGERRVARQRRLQSAFANTQRFIGEFAFAPDPPLCVVARPFSGDVVGVDPKSLRIRSSARVGSQPLDVAALPEGRVVARDWKTGALLTGTLERRPVFG